MFKVGEIVGVVKLKNAYDAYAIGLLSAYIDRIESNRVKSNTGKSRRLPAQYRIKKNLPTIEEYGKMKKFWFTKSAADLMNDAYAEITALGEEMNEWYNNLSEGLQQTDKAERINSAAEALEGIDSQDPTDLMTDIEVYHLPMLDALSRADRLSEATSILNDVAGAVHDFVSEQRANAPEEESEEEPEYSEDDLDEVDRIADQCESDASELDSVEFPGMYG